MLETIEGKGRRGGNEMVGWHYQVDGHEFEQTLGDEEQGSLACCSPWDSPGKNTEVVVMPSSRGSS